MSQLLREWKRQTPPSDRIAFNEQLLRFLGQWLYAEYQPFPEKLPFWDRLYLWMTTYPQQEAQQAMFNIVPWLMFAAEHDLLALYRAAYLGPICRWLVDRTSISFSDNMTEDLNNARLGTWFGSLAGMDINTFCRVNNIHGQQFRPEFRFISRFVANPEPLLDYLDDENYTRVVAVEDMVISGEQLRQSMDFLTACGKRQLDVLIVPLFLAAEAETVCKDIASDGANHHVRIEPLHILSDNSVLTRTRPAREPDEFDAFRQFINTNCRGRFGFGQSYGILLLTYLNCPDNVPPVIHEKSLENPNPLFPRASRAI